MTLKLLAVDDSPTIRRMLSDTMREAGFEVIEAENGREGLDKLTDHSVDLIITDINMMVMGGLDFIENVRKDMSNVGTPILVMTTEDTEEMREVGREVGATGWIAKPFDPDELVKVARRLTA